MKPLVNPLRPDVFSISSSRQGGFKPLNLCLCGNPLKAKTIGNYVLSALICTSDSGLIHLDLEVAFKGQWLSVCCIKLMCHFTWLAFRLSTNTAPITQTGERERVETQAITQPALCLCVCECELCELCKCELLGSMTCSTSREAH